MISGGRRPLPPRDAAAAPSALPYELIRLLNELPVPPEPGMAGSLGLDIIELNLRAVSLRNVRVDAASDGRSWTVKQLSAQLPGNTTLTLSGDLTADAGRPTFIGEAKLTAGRLDGLAALWRKPAPGNPLFNLPGTLETRVSLVGETLSLSAATLTVGERSHTFSAEIGFANATRHLNLRSALDTLSPAESAELLALLPDMGGDARFGFTFPQGGSTLRRRRSPLADWRARPRGQRYVGGGVLALDTFTGMLGGVTYEAKLTVFGTLLRRNSGTARLVVADARAPGLGRFFDLVRAARRARLAVARHPGGPVDPARCPQRRERQQMSLTGRAGAADPDARCQVRRRRDAGADRADAPAPADGIVRPRGAHRAARPRRRQPRARGRADAAHGGRRRHGGQQFRDDDPGRGQRGIARLFRQRHRRQPHRAKR